MHRPSERRDTKRTLGLNGQRWLKVFHLTFASLWTGAAVGVFIINVFLRPDDGVGLYGVDASMVFLDDFAVVPGAIGCFLTGLLYSTYTRWGWFKHPWIVIKWALTLYAIVSGTIYLGPWLNSLAPLSRQEGLNVLMNPVYLHRKHLLYGFGAFQVPALLFTVFLSVFKPWKRQLP